jgi:phosphoribosyl-ATP pyrophosphohydrolase
MANTLIKLEQTIKERRVADPALSYVAKLTQQGRAKIAQKLGEEAVETLIAAVTDDHRGVISESADLLFHLAVLLADMGISMGEVFAELERREGVSGLAEKASRSAG